jgi:cullin 3
MVKDILMYMDRTYVTQHKKVPVYNMSLQVFREVIAYHTEVRERMRAILLGNIAQERAGFIIDRDIMKEILAMLVDLGVDGIIIYEEDFERHFLDATRNFYRMESIDYLTQNTCPDYMRKAEARLAEESSRVVHYLAASTEPKLKNIIEAELIATHAKTLVEMENSGAECLMRDMKMDDLRRMYALFSRIPSTLDILRDCMGKYIKQCGLAIVADQETVREPVMFVQQMLDLKTKFDRIISEAFRNEKRAQKKLKEAFEEFVNKDSKCASHLASYVDELLKSGLRGLTEEDAEAQLDRVIVIFRFLSDKDVFENFYRNHLAKRLLNARSVSDEAEKLMISKLKAECGQQFTSKMEGMFLDMNLSKEIMEAYRTSPLFTGSPIEVR